MAIPLKYNFRSLLRRRVSTLLTVLSIALVVAVFVGIRAMAGGLETALVSSGDALNVLVLRHGSTSELVSFVSSEAMQYCSRLPGVSADAGGNSIASSEIVVTINLPRLGQEQGSNIRIRGISAAGLHLRPQVRLIEGRMFQPGLREVMVSRNLSARFQNTRPGERMEFGKGEWEVVGIFDAGNTAFDSEIWTDVNQLAGDYDRSGYSSLLLRATDRASVREIINRVEEDRRFSLAAQPENEYYEEQTLVVAPIKFLGMFLAVAMGVGACFAAMNTMYSTVIYRTQEIATLRVLGFRQRSILISFLIESMLLALIGGAIGCLLTLPMDGITTGTTNWQTFSEVGFAFRITSGVLLGGMIFAALMGVLGGLFPAARAARQSPVLALR